MAREIQVKCPGCRTQLLVDVETGRARRIESDLSGEELFDSAVDQVRNNEKSKEDRFDRLMRSQEGREARLEDQFDRAKKRAADADDDGEEPPHPFDRD